MTLTETKGVVVFDVDGVVLDSIHAIVDSINGMLVKYGGQPIEPDWYQKNQLGSHLEFLSSRGILATTNFDELDDYLNGLMGRVHLYREREGIRQIFELIRDHRRSVHLLSACNTALTMAKIRHHPGLLELVDAIEGEEKKSLIFLQIMAEGISASEIIFVTDMPRDLDEALAVGIEQNIALISEFSTREQFAPYNCPVCESLDEVHQLLREMLIS